MNDAVNVCALRLDNNVFEAVEEAELIGGFCVATRELVFNLIVVHEKFCQLKEYSLKWGTAR